MNWGRDGCQSGGCSADICQKERGMIYYTCLLLVIGIIVMILGWGGVGAAAVEIAAILFVVKMGYELAIHLIPMPDGRS